MREQKLIFHTWKSCCIRLLNGLLQVAASKILQKQTVTNQRESLWQQPGINSSSLEKKTLEKGFWFERYTLHYGASRFTKQDLLQFTQSVTSLQFPQLLCLLLHKKSIHEMSSFILSAQRNQMNKHWFSSSMTEREGRLTLLASFTPSFVCKLSHTFSLWLSFFL